LKFDVQTHEIEGKSIVVVQVPAIPQLVSSRGGYYRRDGKHFRPLLPEEIQKQAKAAKSDDAALSELSRAVASQTLLIDKLREDFRKANSLPRKAAIAIGGALAGVIAKYIIGLLL
jgi:predicted HTH transcriptional regulator